MCLEKVGSFLHTIQVEPVNEFYNLYEFLRILNVFLEFDQDDAPLQSLTNFYFTFCCESREQSDVFFYGTGNCIFSVIIPYILCCYTTYTLLLYHICCVVIPHILSDYTTYTVLLYHIYCVITASKDIDFNDQ